MIRAYTADDLNEVLEVWYGASVVAHANRLPNTGFRSPTRSSTRPMVGFEVGAVFVHPDHQRSGIGRALMDRARASRPFLELDVFEPTGHIELSLRPD